MINDIEGSLRNVLPGPLDELQGPYDSVAQANAAIPSEIVEGENYRLGKTVLIKEGATYRPYAWSAGFTDAGLVPLGIKGDTGPLGPQGWTQLFVEESDGLRIIKKLADYTGGSGEKPAANIGQWLKADGTFTAVKAEAKDYVLTGKIIPWVAQVYASNFQVRHIGKIWTSNAPTLSTDIPGTSIKWVEDLNAYASIDAVNTGAVNNRLKEQVIDENTYNGETLVSDIYTQSVGTNGKIFTTASISNSRVSVLDSKLPFSLKDGETIKTKFKVSAFVSASPTYLFGWGLPAISTPPETTIPPSYVMWGFRSDGQIMKITYDGVITELAAANALYALTVGVDSEIEILRTGSVYKFRIFNGARYSAWYTMNVAPAGNIIFGSRGALNFETYLSFPVLFGNTAPLQAYADAGLATKVSIVNLKPEVKTFMDKTYPISLLPGAPYPGYILNGSSDSGGSQNFTQTSGVDGLNVSLVSGASTTIFNSVEINTDKWDTEIEIVRVEATVGMDLLGTIPAFGIGFGKPYGGGAGYKCLMYWANGGAFGFTVFADGTKSLSSLIASRAATPGYAWANTDKIILEANIKNQKFLTGKGVTMHPAIDISTPFIPSGNIILTSRGQVVFNKVKFYKTVAGVLTEVYDQFANVTDEVGSLNFRVAEVENGAAGNTVKKEWFPTDDVYDPFNGQSNSLGTLSLPPITVTQKYNSVMFMGNRYAADIETGAKPTYYDSYNPAHEYVTGIDGRFGESPSSGMSIATHELLATRNIDYHTNNDMRQIITSVGRGSSKVLQLSKGTLGYVNFMNEVTKGKALSNAAGRTYSVGAIFWNQGEEDIARSTSKADYKAQIIQLVADYNADIKAIVGPLQGDIPFFICQTVSQNSIPTDIPGYDVTEIAQAQYELAVDTTQPLIMMSNTGYTLPYVTDKLHYSNTGAKENGAMHGLSRFRYLENGSFYPIHVFKKKYQANILELVMKAPVGKLVFDTVVVEDPGNYGFNLFNALGVEVSISSVTIVRENTIRIIAASAIAPNFTVKYGCNGTGTGPVNGARGCLRDSSTYVFEKFPGGMNKSIYNWCPIFKMTI